MPRGIGDGPRTAARIVRTIWQNPRISRVGLAEHLGLDKSTVTNQVARLIEIGIIEEVAEGSAGIKGGRRPIHLAMNRSIRSRLGHRDTSRGLCGCGRRSGWRNSGRDQGLGACWRGRILGDDARRHPRLRGQALPQPRETLGRGRRNRRPRRPQEGKDSLFGSLDILEPIDFGKTVASKLSVPCLIENDANCCAWGELAFNRDEALRDFLFALIEFRRDTRSIGRSGGIGVGFGIVLGGKVYSGAHGNAGEFRSTFCDGPGDLQLSLSKAALARLDADPKVLAEAADELARNTAMLVNTMDFERVYIGGDIEALDVDFPSLLKRRLEENWMYPFPKEVEIHYSSLGSKAVAYGAAGMILDRLISEQALPGLGGIAPQLAAAH